jgi:transposase
MRFNGILRGRKADPLPAWIDDAIEMEWSNGQAEGQINRLKTLKRAMYGRAGPNLLRARMLPLHHTN